LGRLRSRTHSCGFTLVELLVAVAVIAVLASLLFPAFSRARAKARQAACASNIRQVGMALAMYADDYDGLLPPATTKVPGGHFSTPWQGPLDVVWWDLALPYVRNEAVLHCPSAPPYLPAYHINANLTFVQPGPLDAPTDSSTTILLFEHTVPTGPGGGIIIPAASFVSASAGDPFYHFGKMNVCFADGHIEPCGPADVVKGSPLWEVAK
jgi:prepilin-type N-terminal cleavage/methylation domain-containing protein/prepilin-type processing-associated H-X9-DG protein